MMKKQNTTKTEKPVNSMEVVWQLVVEEHLKRGGRLEDLKMNKSFTRKGRMEDKNKPYEHPPKL